MVVLMNYFAQLALCERKLCRLLYLNLRLLQFNLYIYYIGFGLIKCQIDFCNNLF